MLQTSFYMLVDYIALGWPECEAYLERIGVAHGKHGRDIAPPSLRFLARLPAARREGMRPAMVAGSRSGLALHDGILFLKARYDRAPPAGGRQASR